MNLSVMHFLFKLQMIYLKEAILKQDKRKKSGQLERGKIMIIKVYGQRDLFLETLACPLDQIKKPVISDGKEPKEEGDLGIGAEKYISFS